MKTVHDHLTGALENLQTENLKKFKAKLNEVHVKKGCANIPRGLLEKADVLDLVNRLLSYYGEKYAVQVTVNVLKIINCKDQAEKLHKDTTKSVRRPVQTLVRPTGATSRRNGPTLKLRKQAGPLTSPPVSPWSTIAPAKVPSASKATKSAAASKASASKASRSTLATLKATSGTKRLALKSSSSRASCSKATKHPLASRAAAAAHLLASRSSANKETKKKPKKPKTPS